MKFVLQTWQLFLLILASWVIREQQKVIEYLRSENSILQEKLGKKRILQHRNVNFVFLPFKSAISPPA